MPFFAFFNLKSEGCTWLMRLTFCATEEGECNDIGRLLANQSDGQLHENDYEKQVPFNRLALRLNMSWSHIHKIHS